MQRIVRCGGAVFKEKNKGSGDNKFKWQSNKSEGTSADIAEVDGGLTIPAVDFVFEGKLAERKDGSVQPVKMLRDTGARISLIAKSAINF